MNDFQKRSRYNGRVAMMLDAKRNPGPPWTYYPEVGLWEQVMSVLEAEGGERSLGCLQVYDRELWAMSERDFNDFIAGRERSVMRWHAGRHKPMEGGGIFDPDGFAVWEEGRVV